MVRRAIWCYLYNLKKVKNTLLKPSTLLKLTLIHGCFSRFLNCTNGTKSRNAPQLRDIVMSEIPLEHIPPKIVLPWTFSNNSVTISIFKRFLFKQNKTYIECFVWNAINEYMVFTKVWKKSWVILLPSS